MPGIKLAQFSLAPKTRGLFLDFIETIADPGPFRGSWDIQQVRFIMEDGDPKLDTALQIWLVSNNTVVINSNITDKIRDWLSQYWRQEEYQSTGFDDDTYELIDILKGK